MTIAGRVAAQAHRFLGDRATLWVYRVISACERAYLDWRYRRLLVRMKHHAAIDRAWTQSVEDID